MGTSRSHRQQYMILMASLSRCVTALAIVLTAFDNPSMAKEKRAKKRPDPARFGFDIMQRAIEVTGDVLDQPAPDLGGKDPAAVALGRKGGLKGGPARAKKLGKKKLREAAKKAAQARWSKKRRH